MSTENLQDPFGRRFTYLRLSVTEACNFRCQYCLPNGYKATSCENPLQLSEIHNLITAFRDLGTTKVRLTGGEPTLRKDIVAIAERVKAVPGIERLALSTNGFHLKTLARSLLDAGLDQLNVSMDSLDADRFETATGRKLLGHVLDGIETALGLGVQTLKVNAVLFKDSFAKELPAFQDWIRDKPISVRFIELMRTGGNKELFEQQFLSASTLHKQLLADGWQERMRGASDGPAREFTHPEFRGRIGFIAPYEPNFCSGCNRLRVTSLGALRLCLFGDGSASLRPLLQSADQKPELIERVHALLRTKPAAHALAEGNFGDNRSLSAMGG